VGAIEAHLAFDRDPHRTQREFLEVFLPDERGGFTESRIIRRHLLEVACPASSSMPVDGPEVAGRCASTSLPCGSGTSAVNGWLSHLWIAVENLTARVDEVALAATSLFPVSVSTEITQRADTRLDELSAANQQPGSPITSLVAPPPGCVRLRAEDRFRTRCPVGPMPASRHERMSAMIRRSVGSG
jgi:hypothetical protein